MAKLIRAAGGESRLNLGSSHLQQVKNTMVRLLRIGIGAASLGLALSGLLALAIGMGRMWEVLREIAAGNNELDLELSLVGSVDLFLLAVGIFVIVAGIVNLLIRTISLPKGLQVHDLHQLKSTFASFVILVMAIVYLESLASLQELASSTASNPVALLYGGLGFLAVTCGLILFQRGSHSHKPAEHQP
jgi:uncharacterized membrane protein YqhA